MTFEERIEANVQALILVEKRFYTAFVNYFQLSIKSTQIPKQYAIKAYFLCQQFGIDNIRFLKMAHDATPHSEGGRTKLGCKFEDFFSDETFNAVKAELSRIRAERNLSVGSGR
jgi:hypothetical protein